MGGVMVFDASDRGLSVLLVPADAPPTGAALLVVGNEVSGTTAIYEIEQIID